jgi:multidrug efflux pump subunit AcrB
MNLVQPAMRRPLTVIVAVIAVALGAVLALRQMPLDIFPSLGIPTIYVAQPFGGKPKPKTSIWPRYGSNMAGS